MGARPSSFKKGGGYLNEVDATIIGYTWEAGDEVKIKKGQRKGEMFAPLSLVPEFQVDGEDEPKTKRLLLGGADGYGDIEDDGHTLLTPDGQSVGYSSEVGVFIRSLVEGGFPEDRFDDDPEKINFEPMIGCRVRLIQEIVPEGQPRHGTTVGKDKKTYPNRDLKVATVHALPEDNEGWEGGSKKGKKSGTKSSSKPTTTGKKTKEPEVYVPELAAETLKSILTDNKGKIAKSKLSMAVLKKLMKDGNREAVREWLFDDDNLEGVEGVSYNKKKQEITLDEDE